MNHIELIRTSSAVIYKLTSSDDICKSTSNNIDTVEGIRSFRSDQNEFILR